MTKPEPLKWTQEDILYLIEVISNDNEEMKKVDEIIHLIKLKERSAVDWNRIEDDKVMKEITFLLRYVKPEITSKILKQLSKLIINKNEAFSDVMKDGK